MPGVGGRGACRGGCRCQGSWLLAGAGARCRVQGGGGRPAAARHDGLGVAAQRVLQQPGQLGVAVGDVACGAGRGARVRGSIAAGHCAASAAPPGPAAALLWPQPLQSVASGHPLLQPKRITAPMHCPQLSHPSSQPPTRPAVHQRADHVAQCRQREVDLGGLLEALACAGQRQAAGQQRSGEACVQPACWRGEPGGQVPSGRPAARCCAASNARAPAAGHGPHPWRPSCSAARCPPDPPG